MHPSRRTRTLLATLLAGGLGLATLVAVPAALPSAGASTTSTVSTAAYSGAPTPAAQAELDRINRERRARGLRALSFRAGANIVARAWSAHQARYGMSHNPDLAGDLKRQGVTGWRRLGENVGYASDGVKMHQMFMASSSHRANILNPYYSQIGIGVVIDGSYLRYTLDFIGY